MVTGASRHVYRTDLRIFWNVASIRPSLNQLRLAFAGSEDKHVLGEPPSPSSPDDVAREAEELLFYVEAMLASTYSHLRATHRSELPVLSALISRREDGSNRLHKPLYRMLSALLDWFSDDFPENCEPGERGTSGRQPAMLWTHVSTELAH